MGKFEDSMTYSTRVNRTLYTNKSHDRGGYTVQRVLVHHWAGLTGGIERLVYSDDAASANYIGLSDGSMIGSIPEERRAWTSGSYDVDAQSITVEIQNTTTAPNWQVSEASLNALVELIADIARRYGWGYVDRSRVRGHREFAATECPGPFLYGHLDGIITRVNSLLRSGSHTSAPTGPSTYAMASPVKGVVSCEWRGYEGHAGMDIACPVGTPVYAAYAGTVERTGDFSDIGRSGDRNILIRNPDQEAQYYGHLEECLVKVGDRIRKGQLIGYSGARGNVTGPHLHFEMWRAGGNGGVDEDMDPRMHFEAHGVIPGSTTGQETSKEDEDLNNEQAYMLTELFKRLGKFDTLNYGFGNSVLPALSRLDRDRAALLKHVTELKGQVAGLMEAVVRLSGSKAEIDTEALIAAVVKAAHEGAATITAEDVAEKLTVKTKENANG